MARSPPSPLRSSWVHEFISLGREQLLLFYSELLGAIMHCISDADDEIRQVAGVTNSDLIILVRETTDEFELSPLLLTLTTELSSHHIPTRMAALRWINMLLEKAPTEMNRFIAELLPALLHTLSDEADEVVLMNLEVLSRISLLNDDEFEHVLNAIVQLFSEDRRLLETRGSLIVRKLCVLLSAKPIYISLAAVLEATDDHEFAAIMARQRARARSREPSCTCVTFRSLAGANAQPHFAHRARARRAARRAQVVVLGERERGEPRRLHEALQLLVPQPGRDAQPVPHGAGV